MAMSATTGASTSPQRSYGAGSAWWVLPVSLIGFLLVFVGERILSSTAVVRIALSGLGSATVAAMVALRWWTTHKASDQRRTIERTLAILSSLGAVALVAYFTTTQPFMDWLRISRLSNVARQHWEDATTCGWIAVWVICTLPLMMAEIALYPMRQTQFVEWRRVRHAALSGFALAMMGVYGSLFTYAASEVDVRADFSYFRTSRPTEATRKLAENVPEPIKVFAFFPPVNETTNEVAGYLRDLQRAAPKLEVRVLDALAAPALANAARVTQNGVVVVQRGEQRETFNVGTEPRVARNNLKKLDTEFRKLLMKVVREPRTAYLTVGHGEINDTKATADNLGRSSSGLRDILEMQHYRVRDLGLVQGLGKDVPDDATVVVALGPSEPFTSEEISSLQRYVNRGGHMLIALDPEGKTNHDALAELVGASWKSGVLCNEERHFARRHNESDNAIIFTNKLSLHPSVSTLSRLGSRVLVFLNAGHLEKRVNADKDLSVDFVARTLPDTFADTNNNFVFDASVEKRGTFNLAMAVSRGPAAAALPAKKDRKASGPADMRALVIADADVLTDAALMNPSIINGNPQFAMDVLRWLGGEEALGGVEETNEDVKIEHTKQKDRVLFYLTILGAPTIVLGVGLTISRRARRGSKKRTA